MHETPIGLLASEPLSPAEHLSHHSTYRSRSGRLAKSLEIKPFLVLGDYSAPTRRCVKQNTNTLHLIQKCPVFFIINWTNNSPLQHSKKHENR
jgi:hypothetical protein